MSDFAKIDSIQNESEVLKTIDELIAKIENNEIVEWNSEQAEVVRHLARAPSAGGCAVAIDRAAPV